MTELDNLGNALSDLVEEYENSINGKIEAVLDETAKDVLAYIKANCPKRTTGSMHLADSFVITTVGSGSNKTLFISSGTKGRMVHLIEFGFKHVNGKYVPARPFLIPAYEKFSPNMLTEMKRIIENGS